MFYIWNWTFSTAVCTYTNINLNKDTIDVGPGLSSWPSSLRVFGLKNESVEHCTLALFLLLYTHLKHFKSDTVLCHTMFLHIKIKSIAFTCYENCSGYKFCNNILKIINMLCSCGGFKFQISAHYSKLNT
jgi:hypothetical protein